MQYIDIKGLLLAYNNNRADILDSKKYTSAVHDGPNPNIMFIACCDSRLDPALIFNLDLGDTFTLRSIANIVPEYDAEQSLCSTGAAIEFIVHNTNITDIIILGHTKCIGVAAMCNHEHDTNSHLSNWLHTNQVAKQLDSYPENITNPVDKHALESLVHSYQNLSSYPELQNKISTGEIKLHAWFYQLETATLNSYVPQKNKFDKLENSI